jgi:flagellar basal-body rod modification protein FlgD
MDIQGIDPGITAPVQAQSAVSPRPATTGTTGTSGTSGTSGNTGTSSNNGTSATSLQETFLNLLVTELQNQDPTAPVDPTEMVGQLVSLNQLDQLISINSTLSSLVPSTSTTSSATPDAALDAARAATDPTQAPASLSASQPATNVPSSSDLMNLYGSFGTQTN